MDKMEARPVAREFTPIILLLYFERTFFAIFILHLHLSHSISINHCYKDLFINILQVASA